MIAADAILELSRLVESPQADDVGGDFDLSLGALLIAATVYADLDIDGIRANIDRMAEAAGARLPEEATSLEQLNTITDLLFGVIGFNGNRDDYYDPRNSYINDVLDRRLGIPITLSLLCIEVGRRIGVPVQGIGMPGHFLINHRDEPGCIEVGRRIGVPVQGIGMPGHFLINHRDEPGYFVDTFNGGLLLNQDECAALLRESAGDGVRLEAHHLNPGRSWPGFCAI